MVVSDASLEMWNGRDQSGPCKTGSSDTSIFNSSNTCWNVYVHAKLVSLLSKANNGWEICEINSINQW
jgi:hypothetical protein